MCKKMQKIKAVIYTIEVYNSVLDFTHGFSFKIKELFIPSYNLSCNISNSLVVFSPDEQRYDEPVSFEEIEIDKSLADGLKTFLQEKHFLEREVRKILL